MEQSAAGFEHLLWTSGAVSDMRHLHGAIPFPGLITGVLEPMNSPTTQQWSFGVKRELPGRMSLELTYTGSQSWHLPRKLEANYNQPCGGDAHPVLDSNGFPASGKRVRCHQIRRPGRLDSFKPGWVSLCTPGGMIPTRCTTGGQ